MTKLRVYVETSVWSFVYAEDSPDFRVNTLEFFERCRQGRIEAVISGVVLRELQDSDEPLRTRFQELVSDVQPTILPPSEDVARLAESFLEHNAVPPSKPEDAAHVAAAFAAQLDVLVSWNFKHIASVRRADRFNAVAKLLGFTKPLHIVTPSEVLDDDETR